MAFRSQFIITLVFLVTLNLTEFECHKNSSKRIGNRNRNRTYVSPRSTMPTVMPTVDFGVSAVVDNASNVFRKIIAKMVANKRLVGFDSGWYL